MKKFDVLFIVLISLFLGFLIIILSSLILVYNLDFYKNEFTKYSVYEKFDNADNISSNLVNYFRGSEDLVDIYGREERIHLFDVKNIINSLEKILYLGFGLFFIMCFFFFYKNYKYLHWIFIGGAITVIFIIFILYLFSLFNFDFIFLNFHLMFFDNPYWMLDDNSLLVNIFVEEFFIDALKKVLLYSFFISIFSLGLGLGILKGKK